VPDGVWQHVYLQPCPNSHKVARTMRGGRLRKLSRCCPQAVDLDVDKLDKNIDRMMPELGFSPEDNDRLVASYSGGWQMRMCLGKILLQQPDLLLLDEPTNHLDLEAIEWLEGAASLLMPPKADSDQLKGDVLVSCCSGLGRGLACRLGVQIIHHATLEDYDPTSSRTIPRTPR
jgi:ABC transporter